ncbi:hypothetical protein H310_11402 [Aphanomyces invadans]|uniref:Uncharacterized protein n=1 Tax=Aphanomyces invadans TaxID=157072 RepID=A0A024TMA6_9STRA|nr:hypothetical protein H310_11402 [Aphanomyces invadans]ETV95134.1 hypothetical protein H310_11402 [Aphanomyces invadans]|eukprot:XP_008876307.1 hypothetical protein H310_11402 [Aphanomyces invadans]
MTWACVSDRWPRRRRRFSELQRRQMEERAIRAESQLNQLEADLVALRVEQRKSPENVLSQDIIQHQATIATLETQLPAGPSRKGPRDSSAKGTRGAGRPPHAAAAPRKAQAGRAQGAGPGGVATLVHCPRREALFWTATEKNSWRSRSSWICSTKSNSVKTRSWRGCSRKRSTSWRQGSTQKTAFSSKRSIDS